MTTVVTLTRYAYLPEGVFGRMVLPSGHTLFTCEQPWNGNQQRVSCIPSGQYMTAMRTSPVVQRSSGGEFQRGWEVLDVPNRTFIMIHPANWPHELQGCISVGKTMGVIAGKYGVGQSRDAFREFMREMDGKDWTLQIDTFVPEYP